MKSIVINEPFKISFGEAPSPPIDKGQALIKIERIGYCGSDLNTYRGLNPLVKYPRIPGHEIAGSIVELGPGAPSHLQLGQKVAVLPYTSCGECRSCRKSRFNACKNNQTLGVQREGALTELLAVPFEKIIPNAKLSLDELALVEPLAVGFHAVDRARIVSTDTVAVIGTGMIGLGAISGAALQRNATVIAIDIDDKKLEIAGLSGAKHCINSAKEDLSEKLAELTDGHGPDVMIEAVGTPETFRSCVEEVGYTGRVVYIGYAKEPVSYETKLFLLKELDIMGSRGATLKDFKSVIEMLENGSYPVEQTITHSVPFEEGAAAMEAWHANPASVTKIQVKL